MSKIDIKRVEKWSARRDEWFRLAKLTEDLRVRATCESMGEQAEVMARFWAKG